MGTFVVRGGHPLRGEVFVSGAKNSALPLLSACLLTNDEVVIHNCPRIDDVFSMRGILEYIGARVRFSGNTISVRANELKNNAMPETLSSKIRSSIFLLGSMLGRMGEAEFSFPGGCEIGERPIDQHISALRQLGADIVEDGVKIRCKAERFEGANIHLDFPSVGATENAILAAVLAEGETIIDNAAREPEIEDLQNLLLAMGACITGAGSSRIMVQGVEELHGTEYFCIPDRIEAGTFLAAAAMTRGDITVKNVCIPHIRQAMDILESSGAELREYEDIVRIRVNGRLKAFDITTLPYPGFATDMQSQMSVVATLCEGVTRITETVFENRLRYIPELQAAGARITKNGHSAYITGVYSLNPASYTVTDLRGGAALAIAAMSSEGESSVSPTSYIDRGYEGFEHKFCTLGADIRRIET